MLQSALHSRMLPGYAGGDFMGGKTYYDKKAERWYVQVSWQKKVYRIFRYNGEPMFAKQTADKLLGKIRAEVDAKTFNPKAYFPKSPLSVREYATRWLTLIDCKPNTIRDYKLSINHYIIPFYGDRDIRTIRHSDIVAFQKDVATKRVQKGVYNVMSCFRTLLRWAHRNEDIEKVPPFPKLSQGEKPKIVYLPIEAQEKVFSCIIQEHRPIFQFGAEYGLRIGEMRALQWDCITDKEVLVRRTFGENKLEQTTKTGKTRTLGLTENARSILNSLTRTSTTFIFVREDGKPYTNKNLNALWRDACSTAGMGAFKLYNAVRHSLGCQLLDQGVSIDAVRQIYGHARSEMTQRYAERTKDALTEILERRTAKVINFDRSLTVGEKK